MTDHVPAGRAPFGSADPDAEFHEFDKSLGS